MGLDKLTMLDFPVEVRWLIYEALIRSTAGSSDVKWFNKPPIALAALQLTCRQFNEELENIRLQSLVPYTKFPTFTDDLGLDIMLRSNMHRYRSITIEFDLSASYRSWRTLPGVLFACAPVLEELKVMFFGQDGEGIQTDPRTCAYDSDMNEEQQLSIIGQLYQTKQHFLNALVRLSEIRVLVISNMNIQLWPDCLEDKPQLEYLHISADPRSKVHTSFPPGVAVHVIRTTDCYLPLKVLNICANAMFNAAYLLRCCASTIEHLTWTIPDASLGSNAAHTDIYGQTRVLLAHLATTATKLSTLRICVAGDGRENDGGQYHDLSYVLTSGISSLSTLRSLEIHLGRRRQLMDWDVLENLPNDLLRFYTSDRFMSPYTICTFITKNFLSRSLLPPAFMDTEEEERWFPLKPLPEVAVDRWPEYRTISPKDRDIELWLEQCWHEGKTSLGEVLAQSAERKEREALYLDGIIGEDLRRKDYIPLEGKKLRFVSYEFRHPDWICNTGGTGETVTQMMLRLNGRLIDRHRNRHLTLLPHGQNIRPVRIYEQYIYDLETADCCLDPQMNKLISQLKETPVELQHRRAMAEAELSCSPFHYDEKALRYFCPDGPSGELTFFKEKSVRPWHLEYLRLPVVVDVDDDKCGDGAGCHWLCPEPHVPTVEEVDEIFRERERKRLL